MAEKNLTRKQEMKETVATAAVAAAEAAWPQTRAILRIIFIVLAIVGIILTIYALTGVLLLVVLAIFFAYLIAPLVEIVRRPFRLRGRDHVMPRGVAIGLVYLLLFGSLGLTTYFIMPRLGQQVADFLQQAPRYLNNAQARAARLNELYDRLNLPRAVRTYANNTVTRLLEAASNYTTDQGLSGLVSALGYLPWVILIPILAFFLLKDADSFRRSALQMLPQGRLRWRGDEFFQDINSTLAAYIRAQLIACLLIGTICTIGFYLLGVPYALLLGFIAGMLEFIPLVGPLVVAVIAVGLTSFYSPTQAALVLLFLAVLRIVHDYVTYPRIIGTGIHLHPLAVILAILSGHELAGVTGIFLAIPSVAILTVTYRHWLEHRGSTSLVADLLKPAEQAVAAPPSTESQSIPSLSIPPSSVQSPDSSPAAPAQQPAPTDA